MENTDRTQRIAKNSLILYTRMLLAMFIGFYISRVVLNELGVEDYGISNLVGGLVGLFAVLNMSMSNTTIRFISVALGKGDMDELKRVFGTSLTIHVLLGVFVVLFAELVGLWFLQHKIQIPEARMEAATWVFHCTVATIFISIINVPYNAMIGAYERMDVYAIFSLVDLFLRLGVALSLPFYVGDNLKVYAVLLLCVQVLMQLIYWQYCFKHFKESRVGLAWDRSQVKDMSSFAGWSLFGDSAALMFSQGLNILLNIFFGPVVNAARGIAVQVQQVVARFIGSFQVAITPQLIKSYVAKDYAYMHKLIYTGSKLSFFFFLLIALPVFFEANQLLLWWLKIVPEYTVTFLRIILLISLVDCLANPLITAVKATGKIRKYQSILGAFLLLIVPVSYVFLTLGFPPYIVFVVHLVMACIGHYIRVVLIKPLINLKGNDYMTRVILKVLIVLILVPILPAFIYINLDENFWRFFGVGLAVLVAMPTTVWLFGIDQSEKALVVELVRKRFSK